MTLSFNPVWASKPVAPFFLISSLRLLMASSVAAICSLIWLARPRQYSSSRTDFDASAEGLTPGAFDFAAVLASPTTDTPPLFPERSSSVNTFLALGLSFCAFFAASATESCFCSGCACDWDCDCDCDCWDDWDWQKAAESGRVITSKSMRSGNASGTARGNLPLESEPFGAGMDF